MPRPVRTKRKSVPIYAPSDTAENRLYTVKGLSRPLGTPISAVSANGISQ